MDDKGSIVFNIIDCWLLLSAVILFPEEVFFCFFSTAIVAIFANSPFLQVNKSIHCYVTCIKNSVHLICKFYLQNGTEQIRTEQNRTEQNRTEQIRTEQNRTDQNRTDQNRTEQN